jgi:hypothetical protein
MVINTMGSTRMENLMAEEDMNGEREVTTKENSYRVFEREKESGKMQLVMFMKVTISIF